MYVIRQVLCYGEDIEYVFNMYQHEYQWRMKIKKIQNDYLLMINDYDDTYYDTTTIVMNTKINCFG